MCQVPDIGGLSSANSRDDAREEDVVRQVPDVCGVSRKLTDLARPVWLELAASNRLRLNLRGGLRSCGPEPCSEACSQWL